MPKKTVRVKKTSKQRDLDNKVLFKFEKTQFVPVEFDLIDGWSSTLEKTCKGSCWCYVVIQRYINRGRGKLRGCSWISLRRLAMIMACSINTVQNRLTSLEEHGLIKKNNLKNKHGGHNVFRIPQLPDPPERIDIEEPNDSPFDEEPLEDILNDREDRNATFEREYAKTVDVKLTKLFTKHIDKWTCNDLLKYFSLWYFKTFDTVYANKDWTSIKVKSHYKNMLKDNHPSFVLKAIKYALENWKAMGYKSYPTAMMIFLNKSNIFSTVKRRRITDVSFSSYSEEDVGKID